MKPVLAPPGLKGFDTNSVVSELVAHTLHAAGFRFALRYIPRLRQASNDLDRHELAALHSAGLAVMPVQHVESATSWKPSHDKALSYGECAVDSARALGLPRGTTVWLDLEGVEDPAALVRKSPPAVVQDYCNTWYNQVALAGFQPGLYVGWHAGLNARELYSKLRFQRYWSAYNLDGDEHPAVRGVCMSQYVLASPDGVPFQLDGDHIAPDRLGGLPTLCAPDGWAP